MAFEVVEGLRRRGVSVIPVVAQLKRGERMPDRSWRCLGFGGDYRNPIALAIAVRRLSQILKDEQPDVVETFLWNADLIGSLACAARRLPHLSYVLDRRAWLTSRRIAHRTKRMAATAFFGLAATRFVAVSRAAGDYFLQNLPLRPGLLRLARNAVDIEKFRRRQIYGPQGGRLRIGSISRLVEEKGLDHLLQAAALLNQRGVPIELLIAGDGPERPKLVELTAELGLGGVVAFAGDVPSAREFYETIDVLAVPSVHSEGLPTTILEGMAMELPIVTTDVGGANEAVIDGVTGHVVAAGSPVALAEVLAGPTSAPERLRAMGATGRARIEQMFTIDKLIDAHQMAFEDLAQGSW